MSKVALAHALHTWLTSRESFVLCSIPPSHYCLVVSLMVAARVCGQFESGRIPQQARSGIYRKPWNQYWLLRLRHSSEATYRANGNNFITWCGRKPMRKSPWSSSHSDALIRPALRTLCELSRIWQHWKKFYHRESSLDRIKIISHHKNVPNCQSASK